MRLKSWTLKNRLPLHSSLSFHVNEGKTFTDESVIQNISPSSHSSVFFLFLIPSPNCLPLLSLLFPLSLRILHMKMSRWREKRRSERRWEMVWSWLVSGGGGGEAGERRGGTKEESGDKRLLWKTALSAQSRWEERWLQRVRWTRIRLWTSRQSICGYTAIQMLMQFNKKMITNVLVYGGKAANERKKTMRNKKAHC